MIRAIALTAALACAGCPHTHDLPRTSASVALVETPAWRTLTAQHKVTVTVTVDGGKQQTRQLRGVIAVQRPDRLRLRALGPAGITLFDLLVKAGEPKVLAAIRKPGEGGGDALAEVIRSLASDLACAYTLDPKPEGRTISLDGDHVVVREPGRDVRLSQFLGSPPIWRHAEIKSGRYAVVVEVDDAEADAALDPRLFEE